MAYDVARLKLEVDSSGLVRGERDLQKFGTTAQKTSGTVATAAKTIRGFAGAMAAVGAGAAAMAALNRAAAQAGQFGTAMAEVSTLIEGTPDQMKKLREESVRLSSAYGGTATRNAKAFYQALSAGAESIEDASIAVEAANKLAVGGVTDVTTAMAGLMGSINAYKDAGLTAAEASDALFVGMRLGTTTVGELAGSLGRVAPFAKGVGMSFDELVASVSIATKGGIATSEAVSGLKAALDNITKPSAEAAKLSKELGLNFGAAALEGRTLVEFLGDLREKTGGSAEALNTLFGSIEGKTLIMALTGAGFEDLAAAMDEFAQKTGETDAAVEKMAGTFEQRMAVAMATINNAGMGPGELWNDLKLAVAEAAADTITEVNDLVATVNAIFEGEWAEAWFHAGKIAGEEIDKGFISYDPNKGAINRFFQAIGAAMRGEVDVAGAPLTVAQQIGMEIPMAIENGMNNSVDIDAQGMLDALSADLNRAAQVIGTNVAQGIDEAFNAAFELGGAGLVQIVESAEKIKVGFEMGGSNIELMNAEVEKTADELDAAAASADALASALGAAAGQAQKLSTYADGTAPGTGNAGDGYSGVTGGSLIDSLGGRSSMSFSIYVPDERPLEDYFEFVQGGIKDIDRDLDRFVRENSGALNDAILSGGADPLAFWQNFRTLAIDSYGSIIEDLFSDSGAATNAIAKSLENVLNANIEQVNANIERFNDAVRNIDVSDAIRRSADGMSLAIDLNMFRDMEDNFFGTTKELLGSWLKGQIGGAGGSKSAADLVTKFEVTKDRTYTNLKGERVTRTQTYVEKDVEKLGAVGKVLGEIVGNVQDKITLFADVIGGNVDGMGKVIQKFNIDLGKDAKAGGKLSQLVLDQFDEYSDKLAKRVLRGRDDLQRAGESWTDTLQRLADDFLGVSSTLLFMGQNQLQKANLKNADYASELAALFGGVDAFNEAAMTFFNVAYNPEQQTTAISDYIANALETAGINKTPTTRQEYQDLVEGFDLTKAGQREKYAALVELAGLFDMILPAWGEAAEDGSDAASAYNAAIADVSSTLRGMVTDARSAAREFTLLSDRLSDTAGTIRGLGRGGAQSIDALRAQFGGLYSRSLGGDADAMRDISGVATAYANAFAGQASSAAEYQFFTASLAAKLDELSGVAADRAAMSQYEEESLQALLDAAQNGKLTNQLLQDTIAAIGSLDEGILSGLRSIYEYDTGETPGFADGGRHTGGYRIVGERGPELEATGPSRIHSNAQTRALLGIDELRKDLAKMHAENRSLNIKIEKHGRKMEQLLERWDVVGQPPERAA